MLFCSLYVAICFEMLTKQTIAVTDKSCLILLNLTKLSLLPLIAIKMFTCLSVL